MRKQVLRIALGVRCMWILRSLISSSELPQLQLGQYNPGLAMDDNCKGFHITSYSVFEAVIWNWARKSHILIA